MKKAKIIQQQPLPSIKLCMKIEISLFFLYKTLLRRGRSIAQNGSERSLFWKWYGNLTGNSVKVLFYIEKEYKIKSTSKFVCG